MTHDVTTAAEVTSAATDSISLDYEVTAADYAEAVFAATAEMRAVTQGTTRQVFRWVWIGLAIVAWAFIGIMDARRAGGVTTPTLAGAMNATTSAEWLLAWFCVWLPAIIYSLAVRRSRFWARIVSAVFAVLAALIITWVWYAANHGTRRQPLAGWGTWRVVPWITVALLAYRYLKVSWSTFAHRAAFKRTAYFEGPRRLTLSEAGVEDVGPLLRTFVAWPFIVRMRSTQTLLLFIARSGITLFILPKRGIEPQALARLISVIESRVGREANAAFGVLPLASKHIPVAQPAE